MSHQRRHHCVQVYGWDGEVELSLSTSGPRTLGLRPDYLLPARSVVRTLEAQETLLPLGALLPGGLVRGGAGVEAGVEDDSDRAGLLVGDALPAVPEVLAGDVCWPGEEAVSSGAVH